MAQNSRILAFVSESIDLDEEQIHSANSKVHPTSSQNVIDAISFFHRNSLQPRDPGLQKQGSVGWRLLRPVFLRIKQVGSADRASPMSAKVIV
jgi:hypothetical protein